MDFGQLARIGKHDISVSAETIPGIKPTAHVREKSIRRVQNTHVARKELEYTESSVEMNSSNEQQEQCTYAGL